MNLRGKDAAPAFKSRILFVCGRNRWRSPTAEALYRRDPRMLVRSAGVSEKSRRRVSADDLAWADLVLVMERKHRARILDTFRDVSPMPPIESLDIPDDYEYMDPELVELLRVAVEDAIQRIPPM